MAGKNQNFRSASVLRRKIKERTFIMKNYRMYFYVGNDSRSDSGHWRRVFVDANNLSEAKTIAYEMLDDEDLLDTQLAGYAEDGIVSRSFLFITFFFSLIYVQASTMEKAKKKIRYDDKYIEDCREITEEIRSADEKWPKGVDYLRN
jgi:hypothetical protein